MFGDEHLTNRLITGEPAHRVSTKMVDAAIADMNNVRVRPDDHRERQRGRRSASGVQLERLDEIVVCAVGGRAQMFREVLPVIGAVAVVRPDHLAEVLDHRRDRGRARDTSAGAPTHAVGDDKEVCAWPGEVIEDVRVVEIRLTELHGALQRRCHEVVLVHRSHIAHVREAIALDEPTQVSGGP